MAAFSNQHAPLVIPGAEPFLIRGGITGCLLLHGFTSTPEEMRGLGEYLAAQGHTVLAIRLAGHATHPNDLARVRWADFLASVEDGLALLRGQVERVFVVGQSMGGMLALIAAARYPVTGVVAAATAYYPFKPWQRLMFPILQRLRPTTRKGTPEMAGALAGRRELNFPAYPQYPTRILRELDQVGVALRAALPQIRAPVLLIHSRQDAVVPADNMRLIEARLATAHKETVWLDDFDHAVFGDPKRQIVFEIVGRFLQETASPRGTLAAAEDEEGLAGTHSLSVPRL